MLKNLQFNEKSHDLFYIFLIITSIAAFKTIKCLHVWLYYTIYITNVLHLIKQLNVQITQFHSCILLWCFYFSFIIFDVDAIKRLAKVKWNTENCDKKIVFDLFSVILHSCFYYYYYYFMNEKTDKKLLCIAIFK